MKRILIAEDDEEIRELIAFKFSSAGYDVVGVADGEAALAAVESTQPDLVILDWMMPRLSGLEVCVALRRDERFRSIPIVLLTAKGQEIDIERGFSAGIDDYVVKPFSPRELLSRVESLFARSGATMHGSHAAGASS